MAMTLSRLSKALGNFNILQLQTLSSPCLTKAGVLGVGVGHNRHSSSESDNKKQRMALEIQGAGDRKTNLPDEVIFYHPQHDMFVCWHPEVPFPYEMSKPIPMEAHGTESSLKIQSLEPVREVFRKKDERLMKRELMQLTYTAKHIWEGRHGRKIKYVRKALDPLKQKRNRTYL